MKNRLATLLHKNQGRRSVMRVAMDDDQLEMVDKLSLFLSRETDRVFSRNRVIEEAVRAFTDESAEYIAEQYGLDLYQTPICELQQSRRCGKVAVAVYDTVIVPALDNEDYRDAMFRRREWDNLRMSERKFTQIKYLAVYVGAPTSGITHYAKIKKIIRRPDTPGRCLVKFDGEPESLPHKVELGGMSPAGMRNSRYTTLSLLLEAHMLEELFSRLA